MSDLIKSILFGFFAGALLALVYIFRTGGF
jgi:hypothetical protein